MAHRYACLAIILCAMLLSACAKQGAPVPEPTVAGEASKASAFLAYEHEVAIALGQEHLDARLDGLRAACNDERFGACSLLALEQGSAGRASLVLRATPAAIEPIVALATQDGRVESRILRAEDLADAVAGTDARIAMLDTHRANLLELRARPGLSVGDTIALSSELASVITQLDGHTRTAADQRRRIETNRLTVTFHAPYEAPSSAAQLRDAFADLGDAAVEGTTEALGVLGFGLPFLLIAFPLALLWRALWRWATGNRRR